MNMNKLILRNSILFAICASFSSFTLAASQKTVALASSGSAISSAAKADTTEDAHFVISGVHSRATGENGVQAKDEALSSACMQAIEQLLARISYYNSASKTVVIDKKKIKDMIIRYEVNDEIIREKSYESVFTIYFSKERVLQLCAERRIPLRGEFAEQSSAMYVQSIEEYPLSSWPETVCKFNEDGVFYIPQAIEDGKLIRVKVLRAEKVGTSSKPSKPSKSKSANKIAKNVIIQR